MKPDSRIYTPWYVSLFMFFAVGAIALGNGIEEGNLFFTLLGCALLGLGAIFSWKLLALSRRQKRNDP